MDCEACKRERGQGDAVPRWTHEADMARMERGNQRAWILCIVLAAMLLGSWIGFLIYESQFETVTETTTTQDITQTADGDSINKFVGGDYYAGGSAD